MDRDLRVPYVLSPDCIDLIRRMLDRDVARRPSIEDVLAHPWCTTVDPEPEKGADGATGAAGATDGEGGGDAGRGGEKRVKEAR